MKKGKHITMDIDVDAILAKLLEVRGTGRGVMLQEGEIRQLCMKAREIFISQPILLELEAPIKICGLYLFLTETPTPQKTENRK